ncbi:olfactory receptor 56-like [Ictidomys tridecemlineatus]|uniref:Olfactory receptor n=1 Tax=Ictidomys tridecemlineatus TaxID=43179 RepID=I3N2A2_ICTTR|nr:olfactory receptor 56-like [Ictidomys tridecemlineatus]KAG3265599.1 olfactory receptor 56-like [Ictidomys tridecemlineatus]
MEMWLNQSSIDGFILLGIFSHSQTDLVLFSAVMMVFMVALCGNVLLISLIYIEPRLHTPMYFFLSQLSLMDLMLVCNIVPKMAVNFLSGRKSISFVGCGIQIGFFVSLVGSEGLLLGLMAYDRYVAISHPLHYPVLMSQRVCLQTAGSSWAFGILDGMIQMVAAMSLPYCGSRTLDHFFCEVTALLKLACANTSLFDTLLFACCVFMLFLPFSIIVASYARILGAVLHMRSAQARKKALATCSSHLTAVSLFYGAAMFIYLRPKRHRVPSHDKVISMFYTVLTPMLNPLIYSLRNREVIGALRKGLGHCRIDSQH